MHVTSHTPLAQLLNAPASLDALEAALDALKDQPAEDTLAALNLIAQRGATPIQIAVADANGLVDDGERLIARWASAIQRAALDVEGDEAALAALAALATPLLLRAQVERFAYPAQLPAARQQVVLPLMALAAAAPPPDDPLLARVAADYFIHAKLPPAMHDPAAAGLDGPRPEPTDALFVQLLALANELQLIAWLGRLPRSPRLGLVASRGWLDLVLTRAQPPNVLAKLLDLSSHLSPQNRLQCARSLLDARNPALVRAAIQALDSDAFPFTAAHLPRLWHARTGADEGQLARLNSLITSIRANARDGEQPGALQLVEDDRAGQLSLAAAERGALSPADGPLVAPAPHGALLNPSERAAIRSAWRDLAPAPRPEPAGLSSALIGIGSGGYMSLVWCLIIAQGPYFALFLFGIMPLDGPHRWLAFTLPFPFMFAFLCFVIGRWHANARVESDHTIEHLAQHGHATLARVLARDGYDAKLSIDGSPPLTTRGLRPDTPVGAFIPVLYDPVRGKVLALDAVPMLHVSVDGELVVPRALVLQGRLLAALGGFTIFFIFLFVGLARILFSR